MSEEDIEVRAWRVDLIRLISENQINMAIDKCSSIELAVRKYTKIFCAKHIVNSIFLCRRLMIMERLMKW